MLTRAAAADTPRRPARGRGQERIVLVALLGALAAVAVLSLGMGRVSIPPGTVLAILASRVVPIEPTWDSSAELIVLNVRLPRICAAVMVGAALAAAGAAYQNLFRNPIVSPDILGVSAGAGFGASLAVMLNLGGLGIQGLAFASGLVAVALCFSIGQAINRHSLIVLVLVGVVIAAFFQALISILKIIADPVNVLPVITFWLLGGLNKITPGDLPLAGGVIAASLGLLFALRWQINVMSLGAEEARALGVNVAATRLMLVLAATLMTAAAVSISGIIGWVGLVVPHIGRILVGPSFDRLLPVTIVTGGLFLLVVDDFSRAVASMEIPLGITTSVIGAPLFIFLLLRTRAAWA
ncbi:iron ABC transporter permease [Amaricoccus sp.]|uniref:FecCD family ABC transporter permease n=1 Tax=Amaricoccus sp. TaxID=1872485 RepID=UPI001B7B0E76|nr:iron ABC transporter permease [Amaricoccus sp.]MBP7002772.1 iron ABC transporter permease [Amaricoccus sp.]